MIAPGFWSERIDKNQKPPCSPPSLGLGSGRFPLRRAYVVGAVSLDLTGNIRR